MQIHRNDVNEREEKRRGGGRKRVNTREKGKTEEKKWRGRKNALLFSEVKCEVITCKIFKNGGTRYETVEWRKKEEKDEEEH